MSDVPLSAVVIVIVIVSVLFELVLGVVVVAVFVVVVVFVFVLVGARMLQCGVCDDMLGEEGGRMSFVDVVGWVGVQGCFGDEHLLRGQGVT